MDFVEQILTKGDLFGRGMDGYFWKNYGEHAPDPVLDRPALLCKFIAAIELRL